MKYNISIFIPCHDEEKNISKLFDKIQKSCDMLKNKIKKYNIYFIDDCSMDKTKNEIEKLVKKHKNVNLVHMKKQLGKSYALQVGFSLLTKDIDLVFMMDGDLQDDPKEIGRFIEKIEEGYDLVSGYKVIRLDNIEKRAASKVYNKVLNLVFNMNLHDHNCGFKCFRRKVIDNIKIYDNLHRYITVFTESKGFKVGEIGVEHHKRIYGKSKYGLMRYFIGFKDIIRVKFIISHSNIKSYIKDIIILLVILTMSFLINKLLFFIILIGLIIIYPILIYNTNKYNNFSIKKVKENLSEFI